MRRDVGWGGEHEDDSKVVFLTPNSELHELVFRASKNKGVVTDGRVLGGEFVFYSKPP